SVEGAVAERELPVEAGQQIEPEDRQAVNHDESQLKDMKALQHKRRDQSCDDDRRDHDQPSVHGSVAANPRRRAHEAGSGPRREGHTRLTTGRPKTPLGLTISTATISTSAIVSFSSRPT